jgi:lipopolysaccharide export system permease protein
MDRYIAAELVMPFVFGVGAFSGLAIAVGALFELVQRVTASELSFSVALQVFLLKMPSFIVLSLPMSILLATLMAYSRLSGDSEMIALRGCGVSIYRLVLPAVVLSLIVTGVTFVFNEAVVPTTNYQASAILDRALNQDLPPSQAENVFYRGYSDEKLSRIFYARRFDGRQMQDLTVLNFAQEELNQIVVAKSAQWNSTQNVWEFFNGTIYNVAPMNSYRSVSKFEHQQLELPRAPLDLATQDRKSDEMNIAQAQQYLQLLKQSADEKRIRRLRVRIQQKYALPCVCVVFGLVGATLGMRPQRTSTSTGLGISVLIIFGYYLLSFMSGALGEVNVFSPFMAAWLPTILGLMVGGLLLNRASR